MLLQFLCPMAKRQIWHQISYKDFSHTWQNSIFSQLLLNNKFIEDKCRNLFIRLDEVNVELHDLGQIASFLSDSVYSSGKRDQEPTLSHFSGFRKLRVRQIL